MDLDKQAVNEVKDLFDIKYDEGDNDSSSTEGMSSNFADLEGEVSSIISNMEDKGEALEATEEVVSEETIEDKETEEELETIEDLIATSVEEAKAMTATQEVQAEEKKKEDDANFQDDCDSIEVPIMQTNVVNGNGDLFTDEALEDATDEELEDVKRQLSEVCNDPNLTITCESFSEKNNFGFPEKIETSPSVLEDEDVDVIPCKDSEGNIKGEIRMKDVRSISWDRKGEAVVSGGEILWNTDSPTELYNEFYAIKTDHINKFSGGEQLNFARLYQDLYSTSVDTSTEVLDKYILMEKLDLVVQGINRVAMIQVQVNQQQFVWKRFVELLRGALARVQYLKPVLKQDGLQLEHMGDVEFYTERLNALKESAHDCMKNLERAFEAVSRKVSVMLTVQTKYTERTAPDAYSNTPVYETTPVETQEAVQPAPAPAPAPKPTSDLDDYDGFDVGATVKPTKPKAGECGWGDVW